MFQHYALSSYALTCALLRVSGSVCFSGGGTVSARTRARTFSSPRSTEALVARQCAWGRPSVLSKKQ